MAARRVLIIDDDPMSHDVLGEYLRAAGYDVLSAHDGAEGVAVARRERPDLVLLDIQMPELDGFQAMAAIREAGLTEVPVLFLTSLDRAYIKVKGLELGAEDFVTKPYEQAELLARIKAALRRSGRYRQPDALMEGRLPDVRLADLLQTVELGGRGALLVLPELNAELAVRAGELVLARQAAFTGLPALERILLLERGSFVVRELPDSGQQPVARLTAALMESLTVVDDVRRELDAWAPGNPAVASAGDLSQTPELARAAAAAGPVSVAAVVAALPGPLMDNAAQVRGALEKGTLRLAQPSKTGR